MSDPQDSLTPPVLVVSMFETLQRQIEHVVDRLDEGHLWMDRFERREDDRHGKLDVAVNKLTDKVAIQNGGVTRALDWMRNHDARVIAAAQRLATRQEMRAEDVAKFSAVRDFVKEWMGWIVGGALGIFGVVSIVWGYLP
jgi:division protein CdvB (Snf7/Vps24/ESCRT-III family)